MISSIKPLVIRREIRVVRLFLKLIEVFNLWRNFRSVVSKFWHYFTVCARIVSFCSSKKPRLGRGGERWTKFYLQSRERWYFVFRESERVARLAQDECRLFGRWFARRKLHFPTKFGKLLEWDEAFFETFLTLSEATFTIPGERGKLHYEITRWRETKASIGFSAGNTLKIA